MYELVRGPLVWAAFLILAVGLTYKLLITARLAKREKTVFPTMQAKFGLRSVLHWTVPFASHNMRMHPVLTIVSYAFHICLLLTPLFVMGHAVLWHDSWGIRWWSLPASLADTMTIIVIGGGIFFFLRRLSAPEVRAVTSWKDLALLALVVLPYLTGLIAHHGWLPYKTTIILHIVSGALWLAAIPFTWLAHMVWFFFSRMYMGNEFGRIRNARDW